MTGDPKNVISLLVIVAIMAKNLRPEPDWVPAVVVEHLGPLTYLVETTDRLLWKRHIDLLRELCVHNHITEDHNSEELGDLEETADPEAVMPPAFVPIPTVPESVAPGVSASVTPHPGSPPLADSPMQSTSAPVCVLFKNAHLIVMCSWVDSNKL